MSQGINDFFKQFVLANGCFYSQSIDLCDESFWKAAFSGSADSLSLNILAAPSVT